MKSATYLKLNLNRTHLKLVKNKRVTDAKIYINTLVPNFSYTNQSGEIMAPRKCALL